MYSFRFGGLLTLLGLSCAAWVFVDDSHAGKPAGDTIVILMDDEGQYIKEGDKKQVDVVVKVGQTVVWKNLDAEDAHTATHKPSKDAKPLFDTGKIEPKKSAKVVFDQKLFESAGGKPGGEVKLDYVCIYHKNMKSSIILKSAEK
jgi:plastocyanin